jgi:serine/threonine protein kinase
VCALYDVGRSDGHEAQHYLVMELLEGSSIAARIEKGPLPLTDVLRIGVRG